MPTPGSNAMKYTNLQVENGQWGTWYDCVTEGCSGSSGTGSGNITLNATVDDNAIPASLSGSTLQETSSGSEVNTLGYRNLGCPSQGCTGVSNFIDDFWFYIPASDSLIRALEFDPDDYTGTQGYKMSTQCNGPSSTWHFWNSATGKWDPEDDDASPYPCGILSQTGQWHHYQLYGTMNFSSGEYLYQTLVIDGQAVFQSLGKPYSYGPPPGSGITLNVQQQIDNNSGATSNSVYYDNYNLTVW
jgi:hypothetical protein